MRAPSTLLPCLALLLLPGCATLGARPAVERRGGEIGMASYYDPGYDGRMAASGERYDARRLTAAHRSLPFGARVRVTNLGNGRNVVVTVTDRGPFRREGLARVRLDVLDD